MISDYPHSKKIHTKEFSKVLKILQGIYDKESISKNSCFQKKVEEILLKECSDSKIRKRLLEEFTGCGPLLSLVKDSSITEIIINGKNNIFYEKQGRLFPHFDEFLSPWTFSNFIHRLCPKNQPTLNTPYANGRWNQFRVHIITPPLTQTEPHITLRKHPTEVWTLQKLMEKKWAPQGVIELIKKIIKNKMNILIIGSTSSGKTSVLSAFLQEIDSNERVILIEDTDEIRVPNPYSLKLLTRTIEHLPKVDQAGLVKQSLRMRPDRLVMGEVRGSEAKDLILSLATGHPGSMGTLHAEHHKQALIRLELLIQSADLKWEKNSIQNLIHMGIQFIFVLKKREEKRYLDGIFQITGLETSGFLFEPLFQQNTQLLKTHFIHNGRRI